MLLSVMSPRHEINLKCLICTTVCIYCSHILSSVHSLATVSLPSLDTTYSVSQIVQ